mmetsp:Transcript_33188/g.66031  ORF Transcript_33188/g.66031 Transcript_33188/m.66031 type:complete len:245 (+) Transcript_33188:449-1183(+)
MSVVVTGMSLPQKLSTVGGSSATNALSIDSAAAATSPGAAIGTPGEGAALGASAAVGSGTKTSDAPPLSRLRVPFRAAISADVMPVSQLARLVSVASTGGALMVPAGGSLTAHTSALMRMALSQALRMTSSIEVDSPSRPSLGALVLLLTEFTPELRLGSNWSNRTRGAPFGEGVRAKSAGHPSSSAADKPLAECEGSEASEALVVIWRVPKRGLVARAEEEKEQEPQGPAACVAAAAAARWAN